MVNRLQWGLLRAFYRLACRQAIRPRSVLLLPSHAPGVDNNLTGLTEPLTALGWSVRNLAATRPATAISAETRSAPTKWQRLRQPARTATQISADIATSAPTKRPSPWPPSPAVTADQKAPCPWPETISRRSRRQAPWPLMTTARALWLMARSAVTVIDDHLPMLNPINPRAGSRLIQAWHGLGAFKRVGYTRPTDQGGPARSSGAHQHYTAALVSGSTVRQAYAASFGLPVERVQALGAPRTDRLFNRSARAADQASVWSRWPDLRGRRIITIAPTFRGRGRRGAHYPSAWLNLEVLATALSPNDRLILHQHPFIGPWPTQRQALPEQVIDLTGKIDPNALLAVTNLLVTDYSSIIFDFALLIRAELSERSESAIRWTTDTTNGTAANGRQTAGDAGRGGQETVGPATRGSGGESGDDNLGGETGRVDLGVDRRHVDQRGDREAPSAQVIPPRSLVLYQPDADSYLANRGFYRPMAAYAFGPQVTDLPALIEAIRHPSPPDQTVLEDLWAGDLNACDGLSTGRLIALITGSQPS